MYGDCVLLLEIDDGIVEWLIHLVSYVVIEVYMLICCSFGYKEPIEIINEILNERLASMSTFNSGIMI